MPIRFHCPKCHVRLSVAQRKAGHSSPCPNCRQVITIPNLSPPPLPSGAAESRQPSEASTGAENAADQSEGVVSTVAPDDRAGARESAVAATGETWQSQTAIRELDPHVLDPEYRAALAGDPASDQTITLPRWTVYFQAGLLAVVATMFFLLGLMIGQNTTSTVATSAELHDCQLTGKVLYLTENRKLPDEGAVVFVLPVNGTILERPDPSSLQPEQFEATENPAIQQIEEVGGRVVRIDRDGTFDLMLRGPREYHVLIVSRNADRNENEEIPTSDTTKILRYFFADDLIGDKKYHLSTVTLNRRSQNLPDVTF